MDEYKKPYLILFGAASEALRLIGEQNYGEARAVLIKAQLDAEEAFIEAGE